MREGMAMGSQNPCQSYHLDVKLHVNGSSSYGRMAAMWGPTSKPGWPRKDATSTA